MKVNIAGGIVELVCGDITRQDTQAIVNAANHSLLGGGGVDGAIHRAAGPELLEYCKTLNGCETGRAKITPGFDLVAKYVIHTVGPVYRDGLSGEPELLASCYRESLTLAQTHLVKSISFPSISTGAYGYPIEKAAPVAIAAVLEKMKNDKTDLLVRFVLFGESHFQVYQKTLCRLLEAVP